MGQSVATAEPEQFARLPHFRGLPVTYTSVWSGEMTRVKPDPRPDGCGRRGAPRLVRRRPARARGATPGAAQAGRVRSASSTSTCQVCAEPLPAGPRLVCDIRIDGSQRFRVGSELVPLLLDAWTYESCLEYSLRTCPWLLRHAPTTVLRVSEWILVPTPERPKWITGPYGPIGFVKIAPTDYEVA